MAVVYFLACCLPAVILFICLMSSLKRERAYLTVLDAFYERICDLEKRLASQEDPFPEFSSEKGCAVCYSSSDIFKSNGE